MHYGKCSQNKNKMETSHCSQKEININHFDGTCNKTEIDFSPETLEGIEPLDETFKSKSVGETLDETFKRISVEGPSVRVWEAGLT